MARLRQQIMGQTQGNPTDQQGDPGGMADRMGRGGVTGQGGNAPFPIEPLPPDDGGLPPFPGDDGTARSGETPRERQNIPPSGGTATPRRPGEPTPMAGGTSMPSGPQPFSPMGSPSVGSLATPHLRGLYGTQGGLQGGGLGVPLDPTSNEQSPDISSLIQMLLKGGQLGHV